MCVCVCVRAGDEGGNLWDLGYEKSTACTQLTTYSNSRWSLYYEIPDKGLTQFTQERDGNGFLIHVILSSDSVHCYNGVSNSLSVIDGAVIIVDYNTGEISYKLYRHNIYPGNIALQVSNSTVMYHVYV